ncbi:MAG: AAA family ATPase, partial [Thermotogota bacterium]|nr:AAA family ATPase [Thermotogota bacterium]
GRGRSCYLKIGDFSFEAVQYALIDKEHRVTHEATIHPKHSFIESISFSGGILNDKSIHFSPELNTLIGVRGSGKSAILESIRYCLGLPLSEQAGDVQYKQKLIGHTLGSGGEVAIEAVDLHGQKYRIRRILNEQPEVFVNGELQPGISITETVIGNPVYFGQKELSSSEKGFEKELIEKLFGDRLKDIRIKIEEQKQQVIDTIDQLEKLSEEQEKKEHYSAELEDAQFRLKKFDEYHVAEKLEKQADFEADERKINKILSDVNVYLTQISQLIDENEDELKNHNTYTSKQNHDFFKDFLKEYDNILKSITRINEEKKVVENSIKRLKEKKEEFTTLKKSFVDDFAEVRRKMEEELKSKGADTLDIEEFPQLKKKVANATQMLTELNKQAKRKDSISEILLIKIVKLNDLWLEEYRKIQKELEKINNDSTALQIDVKFKGDNESFLMFMKSIFQGSKIHSRTYESLVKKYTDFIGMYKDLDNAASQVGSSPETFKNYFVDNLKNLLTYQVPNKFIIKYRGKALEHHSLGQRSSALILFVLSQ